MSRTSDQNLLRARPDMEFAVAAARGEGTAFMATTDAALEEFEGKDMYIQTFEVGKSYWIEAAIWIYLGKCVHRGFDYIVLDSASRVPVDGMHSAMMANGCAGIEGIEVQTTGQPPMNRTRLSIDAILASCEWIHPLPTTSI